MNNLIAFWPIVAAIIALVIFFAVKTKKSNTSQSTQSVSPAPTGHVTVIPPVVSPPEQTAQNTKPAPVYATPGSGWIAAAPVEHPQKEPSPVEQAPSPVVNRPAPVTAPSPTGGSPTAVDQVLTINFQNKIPWDHVNPNDAMFIWKSNSAWTFTGPEPFRRVPLWFALIQGNHMECNQAVNYAGVNIAKTIKFNLDTYTGPFKATFEQLKADIAAGSVKVVTMDGETGQIIG